LAISRGNNDHFEETWSLWALCNIALEQKQYSEAKQQAYQSLQAAETLGFQQGVLNARFHLGDIAYMMHDYLEADEHYQKAYVMSSNFGNRVWMAHAKCGLGRVACDFERYRASREHFYEALKFASEIQSVPGSLEAVEGLVELLAKTGE